MNEGTMDTLIIDIQSVSENATKAIDNLVTSLSNLKKSLSDVVKESGKFSKLQKDIGSIKTPTVRQRISESSTNYQPTMPLSEQLKSLNVDLSTAKLKSSLKSVNSETKKYIDTQGKLVTVTRKTKNGLDEFKVSVNETNQKMSNSKKRFTDFTVGLSGLILKIKTLANSMLSLGRRFIDFTYKAAENEEALNLFMVTMGDYARQGIEWTEKFSNALYLDPTNVRQYMGSFNSLIKGLGVGSENAYLMSQNLTQLVYDLASFKNLDFETAFRKLQSATSGKIICLVRKGLRAVTYLIQWNSKHVMV